MPAHFPDTGGLRQVVNRDLPIEFGREHLTSYGGLELLRRCFRLIPFHRRIRRRAFRDQSIGGDYGCARWVVLVIALLVVGGRRLKHLRYVANDPLFEPPGAHDIRVGAVGWWWREVEGRSFSLVVSDSHNGCQTGGGG